MFFFFGDENASPEDAVVIRVESLMDCREAIDNLNVLKEWCEKKKSESPEMVDDIQSFEEAIVEQDKQIQKFVGKYVFDNNHLRNNINFLLKREGLLVSQLESILGLSAGYISRTTNKDTKKKLSIDVVWKISKYFKVNIDSLVNGDLTEPAKDAKKVVDFIEKLKSEVDSEEKHWQKMNIYDPSEVYLFFEKINGEDMYRPNGKASSIIKNLDIFTVDTSIGILFLVKGEQLFGEECYELYQFDADEYESSLGGPYQIEEPLNLIADSSREMTDAVKKKFDELYNSINTHANDFTISEKAKNLIDRYMESDDFMEIPNDLPFK